MTAAELGVPAPHKRRAWATAKSLAVELPWIWVFLAVVAMWAGIVAVSGRGLLGTMTAAIALAPFNRHPRMNDPGVHSHARL